MAAVLQIEPTPPREIAVSVSMITVTRISVIIAVRAVSIAAVIRAVAIIRC
jgi:hypothetical protein